MITWFLDRTLQAALASHLMSISAAASPQRRMMAETRLGKIAYVESGDGPPAIFIHGLFLNGGLWLHQLDTLSGIRRCIAVDLLAHGSSPAPADGHLTMGLQAEMIVDFIDVLKLDKVDLVGNDTGGAIAQLIATRIPERIRTLTLTNCDTHDNWPPAAFAAIHDMADQGVLAGALGMLASDPVAARGALATSFEHPDQLPEDTIRGFFAPFSDLSRANAVQDYVRGMDHGVTVAIMDDLARLLVPTLVVWGADDTFFDVSWARWLATTIPGTVRRVEIPGAKLFHPLERPEVLSGELRELWANSDAHSVINNYLDAWNRHDLDAIVDMHTPDTLVTIHVGAVSYEGSCDVREAFRAMLIAWPDLRLELSRRVVSGGICVLESVITATVASPLPEVFGLPLEKDALIRGSRVDILTLEGQRIARMDTYLDAAELLAAAP
jgi:pimeloyl-ACP methyl ester carboxylesterase